MATAETDGRLIERVGRGDRDAFDQLYRRFARPVLAMALRQLGDNGRAEDAAQETFAAVWRSGFSERIVAYRREHGLTLTPRAPAVLVQRMVAADTAGVAFGADPVGGRRDVAVVSVCAPNPNDLTLLSSPTLCDGAFVDTKV